MAIELKRLTYPEYLAMPEMSQGYEILDGELLTTPTPTPYHQWILGRVFFLLQAFVSERSLGVVLGAPVDVVIQKEPLRIRQPDLLYLSTTRSGVQGPTQLRAMQVIETPPDLAVEVLSPGNTRREMLGKLEDYKKISVLECWLVSPEAETVEVLQLSSQGINTVNIYGIDGILRSEVLTEFAVSLKDLFG